MLINEESLAFTTALYDHPARLLLLPFTLEFMCRQIFKFPPPTLSYPGETRLSCTIQRSPLPPATPILHRRLPRLLGCLPSSRSASPWPLGGTGVCVWCVGVACCARRSACGKVGTGRASLRCGPFDGAGARQPPWSVWRRWSTQSSSGLCGCACVSVEEMLGLHFKKRERAGFYWWPQKSTRLMWFNPAVWSPAASFSLLIWFTSNFTLLVLLSELSWHHSQPQQAVIFI